MPTKAEQANAHRKRIAVATNHVAAAIRELGGTVAYASDLIANQDQALQRTAYAKALDEVRGEMDGWLADTALLIKPQEAKETYGAIDI